MPPNSIKLIAFDKDHNLQFEGKCKLRINRISSILSVEPENEEFKMISALFKWNFLIKKNILFIFGEHKCNDFTLVFDNENRCKKVYDYICKDKVQSNIGGDIFYQRFWIPFCNKLSKNEQRNVELKQIVKKWIHNHKGKEKEAIIALLKEKNVFGIVYSSKVEKETKGKYLQKIRTDGLEKVGNKRARNLRKRKHGEIIAGQNAKSDSSENAVHKKKNSRNGHRENPQEQNLHFPRQNNEDGQNPRQNILNHTPPSTNCQQSSIENQFKSLNDEARRAVQVEKEQTQTECPIRRGISGPRGNQTRENIIKNTAIAFALPSIPGWIQCISLEVSDGYEGQRPIVSKRGVRDARFLLVDPRPCYNSALGPKRCIGHAVFDLCFSPINGPDGKSKQIQLGNTELASDLMAVLNSSGTSSFDLRIPQFMMRGFAPNKKYVPYSLTHFFWLVEEAAVSTLPDEYRASKIYWLISQILLNFARDPSKFEIDGDQLLKLLVVPFSLMVHIKRGLGAPVIVLQRLMKYFKIKCMSDPSTNFNTTANEYRPTAQNLSFCTEIFDDVQDIDQENNLLRDVYMFSFFKIQEGKVKKEEMNSLLKSMRYLKDGSTAEFVNDKRLKDVLPTFKNLKKYARENIEIPFLGQHWLNPDGPVKCVEVVIPDEASDQNIQTNSNNSNETDSVAQNNATQANNFDETDTSKINGKMLLPRQPKTDKIISNTVKELVLSTLYEDYILPKLKDPTDNTSDGFDLKDADRMTLLGYTVVESTGKQIPKAKYIEINDDEYSAYNIPSQIKKILSVSNPSMMGCQLNVVKLSELLENP